MKEKLTLNFDFEMKDSKGKPDGTNASGLASAILYSSKGPNPVKLMSLALEIGEKKRVTVDEGDYETIESSIDTWDGFAGVRGQIIAEMRRQKVRHEDKESRKSDKEKE